MAKTYEELLEQAAIIRDETAAGKNTATRVGGTITDAVDYVKELQDTYKGIHAEAQEAKTEAAAAKLTAAEAKTNAGSARSIAQSAVLTANGASSTANEAKTTADAAQAAAHEAKETADAAKQAAAAAKTKNAEQDGKISSLEAKDATHDTKIAKLEERVLQNLYPKIYQLNEGAVARVFHGFTEATGEGGLILTKDTYRYSVLYSTTQKQFVLNVTDEASGAGVRVGTFTLWPKIERSVGNIASSESYAQRDCLYYIFVDGEGSTYYYIDSNGVASEKSATYLLRRLVDKNAADIATLGTTAENAQNAATAANTKISELAGKVNGKQDALTLTVKDNGNIVLANIQGQSKEFMPATPSGDPMHYAYVTAGAEYNDTGADIVKDAPWADMIDDDYTGKYGKTVVHKAGYWYLNGLGDITNEEIREIYYTSGNIILNYEGAYDYFSPYYNIRTMFILNIGGLNWTGNLKIKSAQFCHSMRKCIVYNVFYDNNHGIILEQYNANNIFNYAVMLIHSLTPITLKSKIDNMFGLSSCSSIVTIKIKGLMSDLIIAKTPVLSMKSVLYMINNEAATSPITITLHADVYNRCMANEDILAALEAHTNISIASA